MSRARLSPVAGTALYVLINAVVRGALAILGIVASTTLHFSATETGILVAFGVFAMRFGRLFAAPLFDRGTRTVTALGFTATTIGLACLWAASGVPALAYLGVLSMGIGYGAVVLSIKVTLVASAAHEGERLTVLSWLAMAVNVGAALGPLIAGALLAGPGFHWAALGGALVTAVAAVVVIVALAADGEVIMERWRWRHLGRGFDRDLRSPLALLVVAFVLYAQIPTALPIKVESSLGAGWIGAIFVINAVVVTCLQMPITAASRRFSAVDRYSGSIGLGLFGLGFAVVASSSSLAGIAVAGVLLSAGEGLVLPFVERDLATRLETSGLALAFTLSATAMGLGETIGSGAGVIATLESGETFVAFMSGLGCAGLVMAAGTGFWIHRHHSHRDPSVDDTAPAEQRS